MERYVRKDRRPSLSTMALDTSINEMEASYIPVPKFKTKKVYSNLYEFSLGFKGDLFQWSLNVGKPPFPDQYNEKELSTIFRAYRFQIGEKIGYCFRSGIVLYAINQPKKEATLHNLSIDGQPPIKLTYNYKSLNLDETCLMRTNKMQLLQAINSSIRSMMKDLDYTELRKCRSFFNIEEYSKVSTTDREYILKACPGYFVTAGLYNSKLLKMTINCTNLLVRDYSLLEEYEYLVNEKCSHTRDEFLDEFVIGQTFITNYGAFHSYRIEGVSKSKTPASKFPERSYFTFYDYFKSRYHVEIQYMNQFLVYAEKEVRDTASDGTIKKRSERIYLVPELLKPTGMTDKMRTDVGFMRKLADEIKYSPQKRMGLQTDLIRELNKLVNYRSNHLMLSVKENSNTLDALQLPKPTIQLSSLLTPSRGNFTIREPIFDKTGSLKNWLVIFEDSTAASVIEFVQLINKASKSLGITVEKPKLVSARGYFNRNPQQPLVQAWQILSICDEYFDKDMVLICLHKKNIDNIYKEVKLEFLQRGINSQFYALKRSDRSSSVLLSVATKLLLQMCAKNCVKIWKVCPLPELESAGHQIMVVGADVFHKNMHNSVVSVVSSFDKDCTSYHQQTSTQLRKGDDIMLSTSDSIKLALRRYTRENKAPPDSIVIFRDGVGHGQVDDVRKKELQPLIEGTKQEFPTKKIGIVYVIVKKRLNMKIFENEGGRERVLKFCNPASGTVIDSLVSEDVNAQFYMISQDVQPNHGTATPTGYDVIYNSSSLQKEHIIQITYNQSFSYYNWSGPLKIPAVVMMANRSAKQVGIFSGRNKAIQINEILKDKLCFL